MMRSAILLVALVLLCGGRASAQTAGNSCSQAGLLVENGFYAFNTTGASGDDPCFPNAPTVWYRFTPPRDGILRALLCGSSFNTFLSIYEGVDCAALRCTDRIAENRFTCGANAALIIPVEEGMPYLLAINGDGMFDQGPGILEFEFLSGWPGVMAGDDCASAGVIAQSGLYPFDTTGTSANNPCRPGPPARFYAFTAPASGNVVAGTCGAGYRSSHLTIIESETCPTTCGNVVAQGSQGCGENPSLSFAVARGKTYLIVVSGVANNDFGLGVLDFVFTPGAVGRDINGDGIVNVADVTMLRPAIDALLQSDPSAYEEAYDLNQDGTMDLDDVEWLADTVVDPPANEPGHPVGVE